MSKESNSTSNTNLNLVLYDVIFLTWTNDNFTLLTYENFRGTQIYEDIDRAYFTSNLKANYTKANDNNVGYIWNLLDKLPYFVHNELEY